MNYLKHAYLLLSLKYIIYNFYYKIKICFHLKTEDNLETLKITSEKKNLNNVLYNSLRIKWYSSRSTFVLTINVYDVIEMVLIIYFILSISMVLIIYFILYIFVLKETFAPWSINFFFTLITYVIYWPFHSFAIIQRWWLDIQLQAQKT